MHRRTTAAVVAAAAVLVAGCGAGDPVPPAKSAPPTAAAVKTEKPEGTPDQEAALTAARNYLRSGNFSRAGLIGQLTSEFEQHTEADAEWAVDRAGADWDEEAADAALSYRGMGMAWPAVVDQLVSPAGDGFTRAEAEAGVAAAKSRE